MADKFSQCSGSGNAKYLREPVCIHTKKIYDCCRSKECIKDARVYLTRCSQEILERAINVKTKCVKLAWVYIDVEPIEFNKGFYSVDIKYFYEVTGEAFCGVGKPYEIHGLAFYTKKVILFGSEGSVRIFSSQYNPCETDIQNAEKNNLPKATVEVVNPIALGLKVCERPNYIISDCCELQELPEVICGCFEDELLFDGDNKRLYITIGQFSLVRLERETQLLVPAYDFCIPEKECGNVSEDPCDIFQRFAFPVDEFFPPEEKCFADTSPCTCADNTGHGINAGTRVMGDGSKTGCCGK